MYLNIDISAYEVATFINRLKKTPQGNTYKEFGWKLTANHKVQRNLIIKKEQENVIRCDSYLCLSSFPPKK